MVRIIARLDIKGPNLVKGIQLEGLRVLGNPNDFAELYYKQGADELIYMDSVASLYNRNGLLDLISETVNNVFIPLTVGGGVRTIDDISNLLKVGADRVSINTAAIKNPDFISEASYKFGKSTIVGAIEAIQSNDGKYYAFIDNGRESTGVEVVTWAKELERRGVGEILITSVENEGTGNGFDIKLIKSITSVVNVPVIAHGGAGKINHIIEAAQDGKASALAIASLLHYNNLNHAKELNDLKEGNSNFLKSSRKYLNFEECSITSIKNKMVANDIQSRLSEQGFND